MDVRLSPEQQALCRTAAQVVERRGPRTVAQLDDAERRAKLDAAVAASGWRELRAPAEGGGPLASGVECALVAEELGAGLADAPFVGPLLAIELRRLAGLPPGLAAETVALAADLSGLSTADDGVTAGAVAVDAHSAVQALLLVPVGGGHQVAQVPLGPATGGADLTRPSAPVAAGEVATTLGPAVLTAEALTRWTALALSLSCADLVGTMRGAVRLACRYAGERRQYGVPISSFQAVAHLLADAHVATEGSRSAARYASWAADALGADDALAAAAAAKAYCARAARTVGETAIQVHGGIGNTWDCLAHVYLRRALVSAALLGDAGVSLARVLDHHGLGGNDGLR